ncbi:MAG: ATP-dependent acyl-CoA ligase [Solirubrobacteraceae bacterium]
MSAGAVRHPLRGIPLIEQTLPALLERQADRYEDRPLFRSGDAELSYRDVCELAARSAGRLTEAGIRPGDRIAAVSENRLELFELILGCAWAGVIVVPINTASRGAQLEHILGNCGARLLVAESRHMEAFVPLRSRGSVERAWVLAPLDGSPAESADIPGWSVGEMPAAGQPVGPHPVGPGDIAAILYTSGTTGPSKGVRCPNAQFYWWGVLMSESLRIVEGDVMYTCLPLFHTNALNAFVQALVSGATFVLGERFSASRFWARAAAADADVTYLLGAMVTILMARPFEPVEREHHVRIALAPATPARIFDRFRERFGVQLIEGYGSTETNAPIVAEDPAKGRGGYMGTVREGFHARVVDEHDQQVPDGTAGELVLRHDEPFAFADGYWAMPEQTVQAWRNLWFHTGDRVVRDPDGWYRFVDRAKDAIRRRGENISSWEVEQAVLEHAAVSAAAAFPIASELGEDDVMIAVVLESGEALSPEELIEHCRPLLPYFAVPRYVEFVSELPLTENGKVRKAVLRERGLTPATWDRETAPKPAA